MKSEIRNLVRLILESSNFKSDYSEEINYKKHPDEYDISTGVSGVFSVSPYKNQLIKYFTFKSLEQSRKSAKSLYKKFKLYRGKMDFVGMDMTRKFLELGYLQSLRFSKFPGGKKYTKSGSVRRVNYKQDEKLEISKIYKRYLNLVNSDRIYKSSKRNS
tara:strand:- start:12703 stop:13179 length:477 start_codon:yes stop_codon:yes gene_type:complete